MIHIHIDGAARGNPGPAGYGVYVSTSEGDTIEEAYGWLGSQTNNYAEYCALLAALTLAIGRSWKRITIHSDSQLMVRQLSGEYRVKNAVLATLLKKARTLRKELEFCRIEHVKRADNKDADRLANQAVDEQESSPAHINPLTFL